MKTYIPYGFDRLCEELLIESPRFNFGEQSFNTKNVIEIKRYKDTEPGAIRMTPGKKYNDNYIPAKYKIRFTVFLSEEGKIKIQDGFKTEIISTFEKKDTPIIREIDHFDVYVPAERTMRRKKDSFDWETIYTPISDKWDAFYKDAVSKTDKTYISKIFKKYPMELSVPLPGHPPKPADKNKEEATPAPIEPESAPEPVQMTLF